MRLIKRKNTVIKSYNTEDVDGAEVWIVSWDSLERKWANDRFFDMKRVAKAFLNKDDANAFAQSIYDAAILLQFAKDNSDAQYFCQLKIEKQK